MTLDLSCIKKAREEYLLTYRYLEPLCVMCVGYVADEIKNGSETITLRYASVVRLYNKLRKMVNASADSVDLPSGLYDAVVKNLIEAFVSNGYPALYDTADRSIEFSGWAES